MMAYQEFLLLGVPPLVMILISSSAALTARLLAGRAKPLELAFGTVLPAIPVLLFLLFRMVLVGPRFAYYDPADLRLTVALVLFSLCAHGIGFLFLNDLLESASGYLRTIGRLYVVLISVSLACTIVLPFLVMTFGG
jgi:hypothetical protein